MGGKRFIAGTLAGGVVLLVTGYLIFEIALAGFYDANVSVSDGVERATPLYWALAVGSVAYAALIVYALERRPLSLGSGALTGAIVGLLLWLTVDMIGFGMNNDGTLTLAVVDPLVEAVHGGLGGMAIAAVLSRLSPAGQTASRPTSEPGVIAR